MKRKSSWGGGGLLLRCTALLIHPCLPRSASSQRRRVTGGGARDRGPAGPAQTCIRCVLVFIAFLLTVLSIFFDVSPPEGRNWICPGGRSAVTFCRYSLYRSSVQMVIRHPSRSARPRARAAKGWTSPRVPRVIIMTCLG